MRIDSGHLQNQFEAYLKSPEGEKFVDDNSLPLVVLLIMSAMFAVVGFFLIATVILVVPGVKMLFKSLTFELVANDLGRQLANGAAGYRLMLGHGIIAGPTGSSLILGTFDSENVEVLDSLSQRLAHIYLNGAERSEEEATLKLLRKDKFKEHRRRAVPTELADGQNLWLFDIALDMNKVRCSGEQIHVACLVSEGKSGKIFPLPWENVGHLFGLRDSVATPSSDSEKQSE